MWVPSGKVIRTGGRGIFPAVCGWSTSTERKSKSLPHFLGFFSLATLPVFWSTTAYVRSPKSPRSVTCEELSSSPSIDFAGYRHKETTFPMTVVPWFTNSHRPTALWNFKMQFLRISLLSHLWERNCSQVECCNIVMLTYIHKLKERLCFKLYSLVLYNHEAGDPHQSSYKCGMASVYAGWNIMNLIIVIAWSLCDEIYYYLLDYLIVIFQIVLHYDVWNKSSIVFLAPLT